MYNPKNDIGLIYKLIELLTDRIDKLEKEHQILKEMMTKVEKILDKHTKERKC